MQNSADLPERIISLAWLRGIAAFTLVLYHVERATNVSYSGLDEPADFALMEYLAFRAYRRVAVFRHQRCDTVRRLPRPARSTRNTCVPGQAVLPRMVSIRGIAGGFHDRHPGIPAFLSRAAAGSLDRGPCQRR